MLGWFFAVENNKERLATWQAGLFGLDWIDALVKEKRAEFLGGNGYPYKYNITAGELVNRIEAGIPHENGVWMREIDEETGGYADVVTKDYLGKSLIKKDKLKTLDPSTVLEVIVFDES